MSENSEHSGSFVTLYWWLQWPIELKLSQVYYAIYMLGHKKYGYISLTFNQCFYSLKWLICPSFPLSKLFLLFSIEDKCTCYMFVLRISHGWWYKFQHLPKMTLPLKTQLIYRMGGNLHRVTLTPIPVLHFIVARLTLKFDKFFNHWIIENSNFMVHRTLFTRKQIIYELVFECLNP